MSEILRFFNKVMNLYLSTCKFSIKIGFLECSFLGISIVGLFWFTISIYKYSNICIN